MVREERGKREKMERNMKNGFALPLTRPPLSLLLSPPLL
jgi:hypothetical protein